MAKNGGAGGAKGGKDVPKRLGKPNPAAVQPDPSPISGLSPLQPAPGDTPVLWPVGTTGLREFSGYISEDFLPQLRGQQGIKVFHEMALNDGIVAAMLFACGMLLRRATWRIEAADDSAEAEKARRWMESVLEDMDQSWQEFIEEVVTFLQYGFSLIEPVYKVRGGPHSADKRFRSRFTDGTIGLRKLSPRAQSSLQRWIFSPTDRELLGMVQLTETGQYAVIPIQRLLLFRTESIRNSPEGKSILRHSYVSYIRKKSVEDAEGRAALRAAGIVKVRIPFELMTGDADSEQLAARYSYEAMGRQLALDRAGHILLPDDQTSDGKWRYDVEYLIADGRRGTDFSTIIDRHNRTMATSILADFIFLGQKAVGSFALSADKTALFTTALEAYLKHVEEVVNRFLISRLWAINNFDPDMQPLAVASEIEAPNLADLGAYVANLAGAGMPLFPDKDLEDHLRAVAEMPETSEEATAAQAAEAQRADQAARASQGKPGGQGDGQGGQGANGGPGGDRGGKDGDSGDPADGQGDTGGQGGQGNKPGKRSPKKTAANASDDED